jgi:hypothetical protein
MSHHCGRVDRVKRQLPPAAHSRRAGQLDAIEQGHAISLGPKGYLSPFGERRVVGGKHLRTVKTHHEMAAVGAEVERMPHTGGHLDVGAGKLLAPALHDPVKPHIVFERIGAYEVVVVRRREARSYAAGSISPDTGLKCTLTVPFLRVAA